MHPAHSLTISAITQKPSLNGLWAFAVGESRRKELGARLLGNTEAIDKFL